MKPIKTTRKLELNKSTLRRLTSDDLNGVVGAGTRFCSVDEPGTVPQSRLGNCPVTEIAGGNCTGQTVLDCLPGTVGGGGGSIVKM